MWDPLLTQVTWKHIDVLKSIKPSINIHTSYLFQIRIGLISCRSHGTEVVYDPFSLEHFYSSMILSFECNWDLKILQACRPVWLFGPGPITFWKAIHFPFFFFKFVWSLKILVISPNGFALHLHEPRSATSVGVQPPSGGEESYSAMRILFPARA